MNFKKQLPYNFISNFFLFGMNVIIGIWIVPFYIQNLGVEKYGLIPLATSFAAYVSLITFSFNGAVSRYLTLDLQKKDMVQANKTFNTSFFGMFGFIIILFPLILMFSFLVPSLFNIPKGINFDSQLLFLSALSAFLISIQTGVFNVSAYAYNRLDLRNLSEILKVICRTGIIIVFVKLFAFHNLRYIGFSYFLGAVISLFISIVVWKRITPQMCINIKFFDRKKLSKLMKMSGWLIINQIGAILFLHIDLIIINKLFGPYISGEYAAVLQWSIALRPMAGVMAGVFAPMILISYAKKDVKKVIFLAKTAVKFMGVGMAIPIGLICGLSRPLLLIWLGESFFKYIPLLWLLLGHLSINLAVIPLFSINTAYNKVKIPGIVTICMGVANLILALVLTILFKWGIYGVAAAGAITLTFKNLIFIPIYCSRILNIHDFTFIRKIIPGMLVFICVSFGSYIISLLFSITNWLELAFVGIPIIVCSLIVLWLLWITPKEKEIILSILFPKKIGIV